MTHSPTPEEIDAVYGVEDPVETLTILAGLHCTDAAPLIARIKADAVAECKAQELETQVEELGSYLYQTEVPKDSIWDSTRDGARNRARRYLKVARRER